MKKIYLAGFDVFYPHATTLGKYMKELCDNYGFQGLYPLDHEADSAKEIFNGNLALIQECDFIAANLNDFRGDEMDCGTAFEIGYGFANGKKIYGYLDDTSSMIDKLGLKDKNGLHVENFDLPVNLMIGCSAIIVEGTLEDCLIEIRKFL